MWRVAFGVGLAMHGLIHLMGFFAYLRLAEVEGLPYPAALLGGALPAPPGLVAALGVLWLAAAVGFLAAAVGVAFGRAWWRSLLAAVALGSLLLCALGWPEARTGLAVDAALLTALLATSRFGSLVVGGAR
jgi:hypothetical protein